MKIELSEDVLDLIESALTEYCAEYDNQIYATKALGALRNAVSNAKAFEELKDDFYEARLLKAIILHDTGYYAIADKEFKKLKEERPEDIIIEKENVHHLPKVIGCYIICPCCGNKVNTDWFKCL